MVDRFDKKVAGKIKAPDDIVSSVNEMRFSPLPATLHHAEVAASLPILHPDPFDRILVAQAIQNHLVLVSSDWRLRELYLQC